MELWQAADQYGAETLCEMCDLSLAATLSVENFTERFAWVLNTTIKTAYLSKRCFVFSDPAYPKRNFVEEFLMNQKHDVVVVVNNNNNNNKRKREVVYDAK